MKTTTQQRIDKNVCRKTQGVAEPGNTCLTTPGTCESCPNWAKQPLKGFINRSYPHDNLQFSVPLLAPSVNHYVKHTRSGSHYRSGEADAFMQAVSLYSRGKILRFPWYSVVVNLTLGPKQKGDLDNFGKVCLDALVKAGVIHSDAKVTCLVLRKMRGKAPQTEFSIMEGAKP